MIPLNGPQAPRAASGLMLYPLAAVMVVLYVNTFELWAILVGWIGADRAALAPFVTLGCGLLGAAVWWARRRDDGARFRPVLIVAALGLALLGLTLTDPDYPAKRIHVPQYLLLALVLRRALSDHMGGTALTVAATVTTLLFGIHDEMLQGLHPARSYGLRDMLVNGVAGAAGAILAVGVGAMPGQPGPFRAGAVLWTAAGLLAAAVGGLAGVLTGFVDAPPPAWLGLPVGVCALALLAARRIGSPAGGPGANHAALVIACVTLPFVLYPVIPHVTPLVFH